MIFMMATEQSEEGFKTLHEKHGLDHAIIGGDFLFVMGFGIGGRYDEQIVRIMADTCRNCLG